MARRLGVGAARPHVIVAARGFGAMMVVVMMRPAMIVAPVTRRLDMAIAVTIAVAITVMRPVMMMVVPVAVGLAAGEARAQNHRRRCQFQTMHVHAS